MNYGGSKAPIQLYYLLSILLGDRSGESDKIGVQVTEEGVYRSLMSVNVLFIEFI